MSAARLAMTLSVNGEAQDVLARTEDTLLAVLREQLALTGAKRGCDQGVCGACTVLIDGAPQRACLRLAVDCAGQGIVTVEGLGPTTRIQAALARLGAVQCGYCTPGIVLALEALFKSAPRPNRAAIRAAISGNLCRCTGYAKIVEAALSVAEGAKA